MKAFLEEKHIIKSELLQVVDMVAKDKGLERETVLNAMEEAILPSAQLRYGNRKRLKVNIDRSSGNINIYWLRKVVQKANDLNSEIDLVTARATQPDIRVNDDFSEPLPPIGFCRSMVNVARQIIVQKVREAEREMQYKEFSNKIGDIIIGVVSRIEYSELVLEIGHAQGIIKKSDLIPNENFKIGDRIKVFLYGLNQEPTMPLLQLSRTHPDFLKKLFAQEVPEIYDGVINIMSVARDPGSKAKVAVSSSDPNIDVIGACVGPKGARVQAISSELKGEKIDVIKWSDEPARFIVSSLAPATISRIVLDDYEQKVDAVVPNDQFSTAIGRRGQNVRLASKLTGWKINVITEETDAENKAKETAMLVKMFTENLDVDNMLAHLLVSEGYESISELANVALEELSSIEGFDNDIAQEIKQRAVSYIEAKHKALEELCKQKKVEQELIQYELIHPELLETLVKANITSLDDLGGLSTDELLEISEGLLTRKEAGALIMKIRENWF